MTSAFDPGAFEAMSNETLSTSVMPIPAGEYNAQITDYKFRPGESKKDKKPYLALDITYTIMDDSGSLRQLLGREPKLTKSIFIDQSSTGGLDMTKGKNVQLGRIREACGQNVPGQPWALPMLKGQLLRLNIVEEPSPDNPDDVFNGIKSFGRAA